MRIRGHLFFVNFLITLFLSIYFTTSLFCCFCLKEKITTTWGKIVNVFTSVTRTATLGQMQSRGEDSGRGWEQSCMETTHLSAAQPRARHAVPCLQKTHQGNLRRLTHLCLQQLAQPPPVFSKPLNY